MENRRTRKIYKVFTVETGKDNQKNIKYSKIFQQYIENWVFFFQMYHLFFTSAFTAICFKDTDISIMSFRMHSKNSVSQNISRPSEKKLQWKTFHACNSKKLMKKKFFRVCDTWKYEKERQFSCWYSDRFEDRKDIWVCNSSNFFT